MTTFFHINMSSTNLLQLLHVFKCTNENFNMEENAMNPNQTAHKEASSYEMIF